MVTILTATYNRAYCLSNLYNSLKVQTINDFEWIIVDDGSTDCTKELVDQWISEAIIPIYYRTQSNGGRHRAINNGVKLAKGDYIFLVDSDDFISKDAIEKINKWITDINYLEEYAGVSGVRWSRSSNELIGKFPLRCEYIDATNIERRKKKLDGDKAEVYKTEILRKYPFPEIEGEKFIPESVVWDEIAHDGYKIRWFKDIIYFCDYQQDGLTKNNNNIVVKNPKGYALAKKKSYQYYSFPEKLGALYSYIGYADQLGISKNEVCKNIGISRFRLSYQLILYGFWKIYRKIKK